MDDLRRRFASLDGLRAPDLWDGIELRAAALGSVQRVAPVREPSQRLNRRSVVVPVVVALLVVLVAGAIVAGSGLLRLSTILPPAPSPSAVATQQPSPSADATQQPTAVATQKPTPSPSIGLIAYEAKVQLEPGQGECGDFLGRFCTIYRVAVANADGSDARELRPGQFDFQSLIGWSPDGSRLLYRSGEADLALSEVAGPATQVFRLPGEGFSLSPDGSRLGYVLSGQLNSTVIALYDLATGKRSVLESTRTTNASDDCDTAANEGLNSGPMWSPDGSRLAFVRDNIGRKNKDGDCSDALYVVNVDGSGLRRIVPTEPGAGSPRWSPDGALIAFTAGGDIVNDRHQVVATRVDIYTVQPDGSGLHRLTTDGASMVESWTEDGRIVFLHGVGDWVDQATFEVSIMDADGSNRATLNSRSLSDLAAVHCITCPYDAPDGRTSAMWQPTP